MAELVTIPISSFEITVTYENPSVHLLTDRSFLIQAMFAAFRPWDINIDDVDVIDQGKSSDRGLRFKLPLKKASFFVGAAFCRFCQDDANWSMADDTIMIFNAGLSALVQTAHVAKATQHTALSLHLQPKSVRFIDILRPFIPLQFDGLSERPVKALASVVRWDNRGVYVDGSNAVANAVFLKLDRDFGPEATYQQIAAQIHADENALFNILGIEEDQS